ncbi:DUF5330 domain-containing protein [Rhizobium lemnae]|uniref:DUF5330 domain-containing protein n=1 Tax=Rhizobium lemnae TaxID=1214924 RepID=A0ABV8E511_9HYPH|nr:DUF5330 domain-containing protein [Rhizobium lemnae]MCJ8507541.1 DUF5330 domain-containing protein [Rhizobium lemnae]
MWFLFKTSVVFGMGLVVLSYFSTHTPDAGEAGANQLQLAEAISAASGAYSYISSLCTEKPEVCEKGGEAFVALTARAKEGARVAFEFLDKQLAEEQAAQPKLAANAAANTVTNTVAKPDLQPMPPKPSADRTSASSDAVVTGTVVPLPMKRPDR